MKFLGQGIANTTSKMICDFFGENHLGMTNPRTKSQKRDRKIDVSPERNTLFFLQPTTCIAVTMGPNPFQNRQIHSFYFIVCFHEIFLKR